MLVIGFVEECQRLYQSVTNIYTITHISGIRSIRLRHLATISYCMKTAQEIRREFALQGVSVSEWARRYGFSPTLVYQILKGKRQAVRGQSHQIAVRLGLKEGGTAGISGLSFEKNSHGKEARGDTE